MNRVKSLLLVYCYLSTADQSSLVFKFTDQSNQVFYLAPDLIGLLKRQCNGEFMRWPYILNSSPLIYWCPAISYHVWLWCNSQFTQWLNNNSSAPLYFSSATLEIEFWHFSCAIYSNCLQINTSEFLQHSRTGHNAEFVICIIIFTYHINAEGCCLKAVQVIVSYWMSYIKTLY